MTAEQQNNPLHGLKQDMLLTELVEYYGWDILAAQINLNCFKSNPSIEASLKFLRKVEWARVRLEAFYLYKFKSLPLPSDEQHKLPPRERLIDPEHLGKAPTSITIDEREFFDDPVSGPVYTQTRRNPKDLAKASNKNLKPQKATKQPQTTEVDEQVIDNKEKQDITATKSTVDPWATWKNKNN